MCRCEACSELPEGIWETPRGYRASVAAERVNQVMAAELVDLDGVPPIVLREARWEALRGLIVPGCVTYTHLPGDPSGLQIVVSSCLIVGSVQSSSDSRQRGWTAMPYMNVSSLGPYDTPRAAAAALAAAVDTPTIWRREVLTGNPR